MFGVSAAACTAVKRRLSGAAVCADESEAPSARYGAVDVWPFPRGRVCASFPRCCATAPWVRLKTEDAVRYSPR